MVSVWSRSSGSLVYQGSPHPRGVSVMGLAVAGDQVFTGGGDGRVARIQQEEEGEWAVAEVMEGIGEEVTHLDCEDKWAVVGSRGQAQLWDLEEGKVAAGVRGVPVKVRGEMGEALQVWMVCLLYPHIFLVGGDDWEGVQVQEIAIYLCTQLQVWHLLEHRCVRWILRDFNLHNVHLAAHLLTVAEYNDVMEQENRESLVVVLDTRELVREALPAEQLWSRRCLGFRPCHSIPYHSIKDYSVPLQ